MIHIAITSPEFIPGEASRIVELLNNGYDRVHIRKPSASLDAVRQLAIEIDEIYYPRLSFHDHHELAMELGCGIHLNARHPKPPLTWQSSSSHRPFIHMATLSASCHTLVEVAEHKKTCDYVFLSPIFDSISKSGYTSAFTPSELADAAEAGIIDSQVIALGGVTPERLQLLSSLGFGGAAFLGHVWK